MATKSPPPSAEATRWYALSPKDVEAKLGTNAQIGLTAAKASELLASTGPNALPAEKPVPEWLRFLRQYKDYMQIILLIAGVVSLAIGEFGTGLLLLILTLLNAVVGLREEGKAQSAMNALKSMMKATARVRRDSDSVTIPAEQLVLGD
ncbi:MAG: cation-transporting P-type ATPase, partial [Actinomycetes bacterium]